MAGKAHHKATNTPKRLLLCAAAAVAALLLLPSLAAADYEQAAEHFGANGEGQEYLSEAGTSMAVNVDGAGGVEPGSFYVGTYGSFRYRAVLRFTPGAEGEEPQFREAWGWGVGNGAQEYQRCGPALTTDPAQHTFSTCVKNSNGSGEETGHFSAIAGVAVNQATGNVYVLNTLEGAVSSGQPRLHHLIEVFTATGTPVGKGFGDAYLVPQETIDESPEKLHIQNFILEDGLTVDREGTVYVVDRDFRENARIMSFEPETPGDFEHYVYAGQAKDVTSSVRFLRVALVGEDRLVTASQELIREYATGGGGTPICSFSVVGGGVQAMAANPMTGEVFYFRYKDGKVHRLGPCDEATGEFEEVQGPVKPVPATEEINGLAVNPTLSWSPDRPPGVLYAVDGRRTPGLNPPPLEGIGDILVPAKVNPPAVLSESVANTTTASSTLKASIDPKSFGTDFVFQYLSEEAYEANEPDERQTLTVSATGGLFGLGFRGRGLGGAATADLVSGSNVAENLTTAKGTASLHAAKGTATLTVVTGTASATKGSATLTEVTTATGAGVISTASKQVTSVNTSSGEFVSGQTIAGANIPAETKITAVGAGTLTLSAFPTGNGPEALSAGSLPVKSGQFISGPGIASGTTVISVGPRTLLLSNPVTESNNQITFKSASATLTGLVTSEGTFEEGETIAGEGIPLGTTITKVNPSALILSKPVQKAGSDVAIAAGSPVLTGLTTTEGRFEPGTPIAGEGIPSGTTITAVGSGSVTISDVPTKPGAAVAVSSSGPAPLAVGEAVEGPGIPAGTTITAVQAGKLTLSNPAESTATGVQLQAGLPFDAAAGEVQQALEGLATIGKVEVSGGPGDETGSSPYLVEFTGLTNQDLPELEADGSGLSGGAATATVATAHEGGDGFDNGAAEVPTGGGEIPGTGVGTASTGISGLSADTRYRFRVIASSECAGPTLPACVSYGGVASFVTYPDADADLPDNRAYELVSPADKNGGEVFPAEPGIGSCLECKPPGAAKTGFRPLQSAPDGDSVAYMGNPFSASEGDPVLSSYISGRTGNGWLTTTMSLSLGGDNTSYDLGLDQGLIDGGSDHYSADAPTGYGNLYLQSTANPTAPEPLLTKAMFEAHSPNRGPGELALGYAGNAPDFSAQYFSANDSLTASTPFAPEPPDPGFVGSNLYEWRDGGLSLVNVLPGNATAATGAKFASSSPDARGFSEDGRRVFWKAGGNLYVREDGERTTEISHPGSFLAASPDGSRVLLSDGCLYSLEAESCTDLTEGHGGFLGISGSSEDFTKLYFVATAVLAAGAEPGENNLYSWSEEDGPGFIATLAASDNSNGGTLGDWAVEPSHRTAEASPNGRYLAFGSVARLTGYDNTGLCGRVPLSGGGSALVDVPCREVFLYDSATGNLTCPSCNPTGEAPLGNSTLRRIDGTHEWQPQPRYLSDSGRLFFDSQDRLSPLDTNGRVEDVYQYEPQGLGSCARAAGCVSLISPGSGSSDSNLLVVDESGSNVFFTSRERLVQADTDELIDLYDARAGGGFPADTESQRVECTGESCQPVSQAPNDPTPASSAFHGAGNVKEPKKHHKKKHHKKKNKKHHTKKKAGNKRAANHDRGGAK